MGSTCHCTVCALTLQHGPALLCPPQPQRAPQQGPAHSTGLSRCSSPGKVQHRHGGYTWLSSGQGVGPSPTIMGPRGHRDWGRAVSPRFSVLALSVAAALGDQTICISGFAGCKPHYFWTRVLPALACSVYWSPGKITRGQTPQQPQPCQPHSHPKAAPRAPRSPPPPAAAGSGRDGRTALACHSLMVRRGGLVAGRGGVRGSTHAWGTPWGHGGPPCGSHPAGVWGAVPQRGGGEAATRAPQHNSGIRGAGGGNAHAGTRAHAHSVAARPARGVQARRPRPGAGAGGGGGAVRRGAARRALTRRWRRSGARRWRLQDLEKPVVPDCWRTWQRGGGGGGSPGALTAVLPAVLSREGHSVSGMSGGSLSSTLGVAVEQAENVARTMGMSC
eukprot:XP_024997694.1 beta-crystallin A3 isoform X1 [Gallus gallus]